MNMNSNIGLALRPRLRQSAPRHRASVELVGEHRQTVNPTRIAEHLAEGGVLTDEQTKRIATTLADHATDELATKHDQTELTSEFKSDLASVRNQLLVTQAATFLGILLYITFRFLPRRHRRELRAATIVQNQYLAGFVWFCSVPKQDALPCQSRD